MPIESPAARPEALIAAGAAACAEAVRRGRVTALALCDAAIGRIDAGDGRLNAIALRDFDRARDQARAADAAHAQGRQLPLLGVPMTVKESFNIAGLPTSWGMPSFRAHRPARDAVAVQRLKAAGAVILGKSNVPMALGDWQSDNPIHGRTVHPLDATRTPGGSSGGGAAALAAGMVALELGSDLYGSLRVPAHFCGVYAHKPTIGILPTRGHDFPGTELDPGDRPGVVGPLARTASDLDLALDVLAGADLPDAAGWQLRLPPARHDRLRDFRVLVMSEHPAAPCARDMRDAIDALAGRLEDAGARVARTSPLLPDLQALSKDYGTFVNTALSAYQPGGSTTLNAHDWIRLIGRRDTLRVQWRAFFAEFDALLCPPFGCAAFAHQDNDDWHARSLPIDGEATRFGAQGAWSTMASFAGLPATVAPLAQDSEGLPLGVQIIGPWLEDRTTIALARLLATP